MDLETSEALRDRVRGLQQRLEEAEETLRALRSGEVDGIVAAGPEGDRVFTLTGADRAYRVMVERMTTGALTVTVDGLILFSNERFAAMVRTPLERVVGSRIQDYVAPEDAGHVAGLLGGRGARQTEVRLRTDGATIPADFSVENLDLDGTECLCLIVTDLRQRKRSEEIVRSEKLARSILEQAAEAILVVDPQGRITRASRAAERLVGMPVVHRGFDELFPLRLIGGKAYPFQEILSAVQRSETVRDIEATALGPLGQELNLLLSAATLVGPGSELLGCVVNLTDITGHKEAEEALRASQEQNRFLAELLESSDQPFVIGYPDGRLGFLNSAFQRLTGYSREELKSAHWAFTLTPPEWREMEWAKVAELHRTGVPVRYEKEYLRKDGRRVPLDLLVHLARDDRGQPLYYTFLTDLTERKQVEKERERIENQIAGERALLEGVVANTPVGITLVRGRDLTLQVVNPAYMAYAPGKQMLGRTIQEVWPELHPLLEEIFTKVLETGEPYQVDDAQVAIGRSPTGPLERRYFSWSVTRIQLPGDEGWGLLNVNVETTESVRAREALRTQSELLRVTLNSIGDAVLAVDTAGKITFLNPSAAQLTGWPEPEALGRPAREVFRIADQQTHAPAEDIIGRVLLEGKHILLGNHSALISREGREIPIEDSAAPILDSAGKTLGAVLVFHDITEKRRAQQALLEERARLRLALEASQAGIWEWDLRTNGNFWSEELWKVYGLEPHSCQPSYEAWRRVVYPEDLALAEKTVQEAAHTATAMRHEFRVRHRDGTVRWLLSIGHPVRDADGLVARFIGIALDITERKRTEQQRAELLASERTLATERALRETEAELARIARGLAVGELATSIAHEVNQPLAGVVTNAEAGLRWLAAATPELGEVRESLNLIVRDANRASGIIRRIRDFTKKGSRQTAPLDINEVIQEAVALARDELLKRRIDPRMELSAGLPPVRGDRVQLQQVLLNLIMNGADAMDSLEGPKELVVETCRQSAGNGGAGVCVAVRDRGAGVASQNLNRIFDAFFTTKPEGIGMGLSISRSIVEAHSGRIWAEANEGPGLTVQLILPGESPGR